jgi:hypothetical protein
MRGFIDSAFDAWCAIDSAGSGVITRAQFDNVLDKSVAGGREIASSTNDKWTQMEWDRDGRMDLPSFVISFSKWVISDDEL